ncbi:TPA: 50S ribosomal protein L3 [bacterium]|nr:MAG: 50S ribosomal protein L3 [Candidatus Hydrogenedentes bacterium CG07_land_8_20_14_0_80_42_17]HBW47612.1 50S ribosomal protein L3 [bacterium]
MINELIGRKVGMTQIYNESGQVVPVTVVEAGPCVVVGKRSLARDGYNAVSLGFGEKKNKRTTKPEKGQYSEDVSPKRIIKEVKTEEVESYNIGQEIKASIFKPGEYVDVIGISKGKGFQGVIRRHNFVGGVETHGSNFHRRPGSIGASADPSRVLPNMKMPGRMGGKRVTVQNLSVVVVDDSKNLLLIRGAVPGARGSLLTIKRRVSNG